MAILWEFPKPDIDPNGDPRAGMKVYFFDAGTTTPLTTYTTGDLSIPHDHPVVADADGKFPAIFLPAQITYRVRTTDADGVTLDDIDNVSTPVTVAPEPPEGDTPAEFLFRTGDIKMAWRNSVPTGFVRCNGRTIGSGVSAATERANNDTQALFEFLWNEDSSLAVSGGRGGTAVGDFNAAKTITLPDFRGSAPIGPDSFGAAAIGRVTDARLGADSDLLGARGGSQEHVLTVAELAAHNHSGTSGAGGAHGHSSRVNPVIEGSTGKDSTGGLMMRQSGQQTYGPNTGAPNDAPGTQIGAAPDHTHSIPNAGSGTAHNNLQPSVVVPFFIKL